MPEWNTEDLKQFTNPLKLVQEASVSSEGSKSCSSSRIKKRCVSECSQWTLHIHKVDNLSGRPPVLIKLFDMVSVSFRVADLFFAQPMEDRQFKVFEQPVIVGSDIITEAMVREELQVVLNQRVDDIEEDLRREAALSSTRRESYN